MTDKIERKTAALEVIKYLKNLKFLSIFGVIGCVSTMVIPYVTSFFYIINFVFLMPFLWFLYKSNGEMTRLATKYNINIQKPKVNFNQVLNNLNPKQNNKPKVDYQATNHIDKEFFKSK